MLAFSYYTPTKVLFGRDTERKVADLIREFGGKKVLIHYGGGSVIRSGLLKRVTDSLDGEGIPYVTLGGAVPNPRLGLVYEGMRVWISFWPWAAEARSILPRPSDTV